MSAAIPAKPIVDAILATLTADLPDSYGVHDAVGPLDPVGSCPYVVVYADNGAPEGEPMQVSRSLIGQFSVRAVGETPDQSRRGGDRVRASLHGRTLTVDGRQVYLWQQFANSIQRDDSVAPAVLFEHLLLFGFRSDS